jgi:hypothetical protein
MKNSLLKTAFAFIVILLMIVLLIPASFVRESIFPSGRGPDGLYRGGDGLLPGIVIVFCCLWVANRITGTLFWKAHLSDERWSLLTSRRSRRRG